MKRNTFVLAGLLLLASIPSLYSAVTLSLVNGSNTNSSTVTVMAGSSFTASVYVKGLTSSLPLDSFDVQLAEMPSGFSITGANSSVSNWSINTGLYASGYVGGWANASSNDLTGNVILANFTIALDPAVLAGQYELDFTSDSWTALSSGLDASYNPISIAFIEAALSVNVNVVPEPSAGLLIVVGGCFALGAAFKRKTKKNDHSTCGN